MSTTADRIDPAQGALESGTWKGEYLDSYGHRGGLRFELEVAGGAIRGQYTLTVRAEDRPQTITGSLEGKLEGDRARLYAVAGKQATRMEFDAVVRRAGSYARQALFGTVHDAPEQNFGGGVWIVWRFAKSDDRPQAERG